MGSALSQVLGSGESCTTSWDPAGFLGGGDAPAMPLFGAAGTKRVAAAFPAHPLSPS